MAFLHLYYSCLYHIEGCDLRLWCQCICKWRVKGFDEGVEVFSRGHVDATACLQFVDVPNVGVDHAFQWCPSQKRHWKCNGTFVKVSVQNISSVYEECQTQVSKGFGTAMRIDSSKWLQRYPTTYKMYCARTQIQPLRHKFNHCCGREGWGYPSFVCHNSGWIYGQVVEFVSAHGTSNWLRYPWYSVYPIYETQLFYTHGIMI